MFIADDITITNPGEINNQVIIDRLQVRIKEHGGRFELPERILRVPGTGLKTYQLAMTYKIGFLVTAYRRIYRDWSLSRIFKELFEKFQVYLSERNMQNYLSRYRKLEYRLYIPG